MICDLDDLNKMLIRRETSNARPAASKPFSIRIVDFPAVAVAFEDLLLAIGGGCLWSLW